MSMKRSSPLTALFAVSMVASLARAQAPQAPPATLAPPIAAPDTGLPFEPVVGETAGDRVWVDMEYLLWWMRGQSLPALATTSPAGSPASTAGIIGSPGTTVLFGDSSANTGGRSGGRIEAGTWFGDGELFGVEANFFMLESKATNFAANSSGSPILARPYIDAETMMPAAIRVAYPGEFTGSIDANATTTGLIGAGFLFRGNLLAGANYRLDLLGGYSYLRFADSLDVSQDQTADVGNPNFLVPGTHIVAADQFSTKNSFNGVDLGLSGEFRFGRLSLNLLGKLAVGFTQQDVDIFGLTTVTVPGSGAVTSTGGLLALTSNIGHYSLGNEVSVIPDFEAKLAYQITSRIRATLGYSILYWDNVVRAGDQVDRVVNTNLLPNSGAAGGPANPAFQFEKNSIWVQGLELGLEFRF
jgi:hypothetical protein